MKKFALILWFLFPLSQSFADGRDDVMAAPSFSAIKNEGQYGKIDPRARRHAQMRYRGIGKELDGNLIPTAKRTDWLLNLKVNKAIQTLSKHHDPYAAVAQAEWDIKFKGRLTEWALEYQLGRDVGDHPGLVKFIDTIYEKLITLIGFPAAKAILGDVYALNHEIPVVFKPCTFDMTGIVTSRMIEYRNHFAYGREYWGLTPIVCKYAVMIPCMIGSSGIGAFLCGPAGMAAEYLFGTRIAPKLSDRIFNKVCKQGD